MGVRYLTTAARVQSETLPGQTLPQPGALEDIGDERVAQPEALSPAYAFLASPVCAGCITGIVLLIAGNVAAI